MLFFVSYEMTINRLETKNNSGLTISLSKYSVTFIEDLYFDECFLGALESIHRTELIFFLCVKYIFSYICLIHPYPIESITKKRKKKKYQREQTQSTCVKKEQ